MEPILSPKPKGRVKRVILNILGITFLIWLVAFVGFTGYFLWQLKYGSLEEITATHSEFKSAKFTAATQSNGGPRAPANGWTPYIHAFNPVIGPENSTITIVAFIDFECPYSQENYPVFKEMIDIYGGAARIVFKYLPLTSIHPNALAATEAAACANDQGKFWPYYHYLFGTKKLSAKDLQTAATAVGLEYTAFNTCLSSHKYQSAIETDVNDAIALGVRGTPTYFINNDIIEGGTDRSVWDAAILRNLKQ